ncbi:hypothetical protein BDN72DRAFT_893212 [Pluteus cervinus]|uniref:Uncharacterized protein n=1 Tax=Pluteus cervinus TaxID=181527 RepID=A0ACD3B9A7_9AGAR|nr:hypothetical protein BDN72DRAFT_893212 [Pluteus cervinus]
MPSTLPLTGVSPFICLPLEITEEVINNLGTTELLALAKTCQEFNVLCLRRFFSLHEIDEPTNLFQATLELTSLPDAAAGNPFDGLAVAFDITTIEDLHCILQPSPSFPLQRILHVLRRVIWAIERLHRIRNVTLTLEMGNGFTMIYEDQLSVLQEWKEVMGSFLNMFVEKGCESLKVFRGCLPLKIQSQMDILGTNTLAHHPRSNILQRAKSLFADKDRSESISRVSPTIENALVMWSAYKDREIPPLYLDSRDLVHLSEGAGASSQLKHLQISSKVLLRPPCSHWTYSILQTPNLTSLHLYYILPEEAAWAHIFSWIFLSVRTQLRELSIELCYGLPMMPLIDFVVGLQGLTHLKLAYPVPIVHGHKPQTTWKLGSPSNIAQVLPNLVSLHAFPDWIQLLCPESASKSTVTSLSRHFRLQRPTSTNPSSSPPLPSQSPTRPKIQHLHILPCAAMTSHGEFDFNLSLNVLRPVLQSSSFPFASSNFRVALELSDTYTITHMARDIVHLGGADPRSRTAQTSRRRAQRPAGYELYDRITELIVCNQWGILQRRQCEIACEFFSMWKGVRRVEFRPIVPDAWKDEDVKMLMEEARISCRNVREFVLGGKVYVVADSEEERGHQPP